MTTAHVTAENGHQVIHLPADFHLEAGEVILKRVGRSVLLIPRDSDRWAIFTDALNQFTPDYMAHRDQPPAQVREPLE